MKALIHDLGADFTALIKDSFDETIDADGRYAPCRGCFDCWTKSPAECFFKDKLQHSCRILGKAEELVIVTENCYGTYSPEVKNVLDRSIGSSTPFSTYRGGQMHHTLRYRRHDILRVYAYGGITERERKTFELMTERNAINDGFKSHEFRYFASLDELKEALA